MKNPLIWVPSSVLKSHSPEFPNRIRAMAARALGRIGDPEAIPDLITNLENNQPRALTGIGEANSKVRVYATNTATSNVSLVGFA